jgi:mannose-6-phosphate isomerase-like protein (cupin superfamily)
MQPSVIKFSSAAEYFFREGCFINELSNRPDDDELSIAQARVRPGEGTRWHLLKDRIERYVILQGSGMVEIGDQPPQGVTVGDVVCIPAGCPQRIINGGETDLVFLALCTPRFVPDCYVEMSGDPSR